MSDSADFFGFVNFTSYYKKHASQELSWLISDGRDLFEFNLKNRYDDLKRFGWLDKKITYKFNSMGFRCEEFTDQPSAMFLGCSMTVGIGLPVEETWPSIVSKSLNLQCANLGIGGSSPDTAFRMCLGYIDKIKPKVVVYNQPPPGRLEIINSEQEPSAVNLIVKDLPVDYLDDYLKKYIIDISNFNVNYLKNYFAIKLLCEERNIKFVSFGNFKKRGIGMPWNPDDLARDLIHPGTRQNRDFASYVLTHI